LSIYYIIAKVLALF